MDLRVTGTELVKAVGNTLGCIGKPRPVTLALVAVMLPACGDGGATDPAPEEGEPRTNAMGWAPSAPAPRRRSSWR